MPDTDQPLSGQRILVVEDEFLIAMDGCSLRARRSPVRCRASIRLST